MVTGKVKVLPAEATDMYRRDVVAASPIVTPGLDRCEW